MLNNLPADIIKYLIEELPPYTGILIFKVDSESSIIDFHGPFNEYLDKSPKRGESIYHYLIALDSMIPPLISPMVLHKIQSKDETYCDIHIYERNEDEYWLFIVNQSHEVNGIKDILQKLNETKFKDESAKKENESSEESLLDIFDYLVLRVLGPSEAKISGRIPNWFSSDKFDYKEGQSIDFTEVFPYLEVFLMEAEEFWMSNTEGKIKSGIWTETLVNNKEVPLTAYAVNKNNEHYILISPLEDSIDKEQLALQLARDQKLAYEKLEKAEKKLRTLLDYKDKFVSIISHDLRSPVAAVLGITEMLVNDKDELEKLDDFYKEMIYNVKEEMVRLLDYNDKLYHWSNLELGNFEIVKEEISIEKIIEITERTAEKKLKAKNIFFKDNIKKDIKINVDVTLFLQVLNNLMANAIKFTPEEGEISINLKDNELIISDSGVGMPMDVAKNIFNGFFRNSTMGTGGEKGSGLGLGIVKKIIDAHGFGIRVESELGKGSDFIISIN